MAFVLHFTRLFVSLQPEIEKRHVWINKIARVIVYQEGV